MKKLTPKHRVLKRWPGSWAKVMTPTSWFVYTLLRPHKVEVEIGTGMTAREAWQDAEIRTRGDGDK